MTGTTWTGATAAAWRCSREFNSAASSTRAAQELVETGQRDNASQGRALLPAQHQMSDFSRASGSAGDGRAVQHHTAAEYRSAAGPFMVAALLMLLQIIIAGRYFPETKGLALQG